MANTDTAPRKKLPERRCTGCGERKPKTELIRVVRGPDGSVSLDFTGKKAGRGAYLCRDPKCLKKALKAHRLEQNLECSIPEELYGALEKEFEDNDRKPS